MLCTLMPSSISMCDALLSEQDVRALESTFSNLPVNHIVLSIRPLSKHFKKWADERLGKRSNQVAPSSEVP